MRSIWVLVTATAGVLSGASATCLVLAPDQVLRARISTRSSPCFLVTVASGEATQLIADQPADLAFRIGHGTNQITIDGFEFGDETLTLSAPGRYLVDLRAVD